MRAYLFHGLRLTVSGEESVVAALDRRLGRFPAANMGSRSDLDFEFCRVPDASHHAVSRPDGPGRPVLDLHQGQALYFDQHQLLFIDYPGQARVLCDVNTGRVRVSYLDSEGRTPWLLAHPCLMIPLAELLKRQGMYMVHAAGLCLHGKGLLIAGASGAGKTTLAAALLRAGFDFLGDDTVFLHPRSGGLRVLAFPDEMDLTAHTASFFPELRSLVPPSSGVSRPKQAVNPAQVYGAATCWECAPAVLVFPRTAPAKASVLTPIARDAAFLELICNVLRTEIQATQAHLSVLAALAQQCLCLRLETGRDFEELPALLRSVLRVCFTNENAYVTS